jgi:flavin reductase (DIM6/NTAB) family NADH-FMN oxidoreductase RutF
MPHFKEDLSAGLKAGMRRLAASVCVISLKDKQGIPHAMTATAVTSLSDNPPALLVCVNKQATAYRALMERQPFCVNVLNQHQADISMHCAGKSEEGRFAKGQWRDHSNGLPCLADAEAIFFCSNDQVIEYGSHIITIGKLTEVLTPDRAAAPLLYVDGKYSSIS